MNNTTAQPGKALLRFIAANDFLERLQFAIGALCIFLFVASVFTDVLFRIFFEPIIVLEETSRFFFLWSVFIGSSITVRRKTFLKIDMITSRLSGAPRAIFSSLAYAISMLFTLVLLYFGNQFALGGLNKLSYPSGVPLFYFRLCIPFSALFMLIFTIEGIIRSISGHDPEPLSVE